MYSTENEIYSLASCPGIKYSGDTITLRATPRDGIGPYYVAFKKDGIIIDPSRLGGQPNPITNAPENVEITRTYTLDDADVRNAITGTIDFSVFTRGSCPTGGGLQFDGVNDYVDAGNAVSLIPQANSITAGVWFKRGSAAITDYEMLFSIGGWVSGTESSYYLSLNPTGIYRHFGDDSNGVEGGISGTLYNDSEWHFATLVINRTSNEMNVYIDGSLKNSVSISVITGSSFPSENFIIGAIQYGGSKLKHFKGSIDEVRIYNRALSPTEVLNNYNGYTSRNGLVLEHIYSLGNANDLSGYGNNGTLINGPIFIPNACMDTCTVAMGCIAPVCNFVVT